MDSNTSAMTAVDWPATQQSATQGEPSAPTATQPPDSGWQYGGFLDIGYLHDFNDLANHLFRSRSTTFHVNEWDVNMAVLYLKKTASETSRWGTELTWQAGEDSKLFGFSATAPNLPGSNWLRHLGPTDISYLAPVGKGLNLQGGVFSSLIGYDSLYSKDNFTYTRPWGADVTPYFMEGVNASYPFTSKVMGTLFVVNGYWHLADANSVPSLGGQLAYKPTDLLTLKQTVLYGPHQSNTSLWFWRFLSDSIVERKGDRITDRLRIYRWNGEHRRSRKPERTLDGLSVAGALGYQPAIQRDGPPRGVLGPRWAYDGVLTDGEGQHNDAGVSNSVPPGHCHPKAGAPHLTIPVDPVAVFLMMERCGPESLALRQPKIS
jgi:hypothetical protein